MIHLNRLLFPTDGSDCAEQARHHAFYLADRFAAALHAIHVEEREAELSDVIDIREADVLADLHAPMDGDARVAEPRVQEHRVVHASAVDGILSYAAEHDANLIVMGTHGRSGLRRLVLGSVAEEVVRRAPVPVLTVGRGAKPPEAMDAGHLLVPVDFSERQDRLVAHARELALAYGMTLTLLHVVDVESLPEVYGVYADPPEPGELADRTAEALEERAADLRARGVDVTVEVRNGHPAEETLDAADELDVDLLAIATHGRSGVERILLGSVAEKVIRRAPCPVFTVKSFGQSLVLEDDSPSDE
jgi:nucleotide-binding universal stress UspA family protein